MSSQTWSKFNEIKMIIAYDPKNKVDVPGIELQAAAGVTLNLTAYKSEETCMCVRLYVRGAQQERCLQYCYEVEPTKDPEKFIRDLYTIFSFPEVQRPGASKTSNIITCNGGCTSITADNDDLFFKVGICLEKTNIEYVINNSFSHKQFLECTKITRKSNEIKGYKLCNPCEKKKDCKSSTNNPRPAKRICVEINEEDDNLCEREQNAARPGPSGTAGQNANASAAASALLALREGTPCAKACTPIITPNAGPSGTAQAAARGNANAGPSGVNQTVQESNTKNNYKNMALVSSTHNQSNNSALYKLIFYNGETYINATEYLAIICEPIQGESHDKKASLFVYEKNNDQPTVNRYLLIAHKVCGIYLKDYTCSRERNRIIRMAGRLSRMYKLFSQQLTDNKTVNVSGNFNVSKDQTTISITDSTSNKRITLTVNQLHDNIQPNLDGELAKYIEPENNETRQKKRGNTDGSSGNAPNAAGPSGTAPGQAPQQNIDICTEDDDHCIIVGEKLAANAPGPSGTAAANAPGPSSTSNLEMLSPIPLVKKYNYLKLVKESCTYKLIFYNEVNTFATPITDYLAIVCEKANDCEYKLYVYFLNNNKYFKFSITLQTVMAEGKMPYTDKCSNKKATKNSEKLSRMYKLFSGIELEHGAETTIIRKNFMIEAKQDESSQQLIVFIKTDPSDSKAIVLRLGQLISNSCPNLNGVLATYVAQEGKRQIKPPPVGGAKKKSRKLKKSGETVIINNKTKNVYYGPKGGRYIKSKGSYVLLTMK